MLENLGRHTWFPGHKFPVSQASHPCTCRRYRQWQETPMFRHLNPALWIYGYGCRGRGRERCMNRDGKNLSCSFDHEEILIVLTKLSSVVMLWLRSVVLQLANPRLLKGGEGSQDGSCNPDRVPALMPLMTLIFIVLNARNVIFFCTLSAMPGYTVLPTDHITSVCRSL